jgi:hypothetical protein
MIISRQTTFFFKQYSAVLFHPGGEYALDRLERPEWGDDLNRGIGKLKPGTVSL